MRQDLPDDAIRVGTVAQMLSISPATVVRWTKEGKLTPLSGGEDGSHRYYSRRSILAFLAQQRLEQQASHPSKPPVRPLTAILYVQATDDTAATLLTATLLGWSAAQNYQPIATARSLPDLFQAIWNLQADAVITDNPMRIGTQDTTALLHLLCDTLGISLLYTGNLSLNGTTNDEFLERARQAARDFLSAMLDPDQADQVTARNAAEWATIVERASQSHKRPLLPGTTRPPHH